MLSADQALAFRDKRYAVFFRLDTPEPIRLWSGRGEIALPADAVETTEGAIYNGIPLTGLPSLASLINGKAARTQFALSGAAVDAEVAALASREAHLVQGRTVRVGLLPLDSKWQPVGGVIWLHTGTADVVRTTRRPGADGGEERQIILEAGSRFTGRRQPKQVFYTPQDQSVIDAADRAFDNVARLNAGTQKTWPRG